MERIKLAELPILNNLTKDYISGQLSSALYHHPPTSDGLAAAIEDRKSGFQVDRKALVSVLQEQYRNLEHTEASNAQIERLADENTFTVTTGHQLCLYTGPLYFIYKLASAISLARQLNEQHADAHVVPVYWMATEDHDFEEINHAHIFHDTLTWETDATGQVGDMLLDGITDLNGKLIEIFGDSPHAEELSSLVRASYRTEFTLTEATRRFVHGLFGEYGLVILDADNRELKKSMREMAKRELTDQVSHHAIRETIESLSDYNIQSNPREINLFYLDKGLRERIIQDGEDYKVNETNLSFSKEELLNLLENKPERFSPNVNLRPVYQELILPNLAYIGGGGELSYWLELKKTFDVLNAFYPVLLLRDSFLQINKGTQKKIDKYELSIEELFEDKEPIIQDRVKQESETELNLSEEKKAVAELFNGLIPKVSRLDKSLEPSAKSELSKVMKSLETLEHKMMRAEKKNHDQTVSQINAVYDKVFPDGTFQERYENFMMYYLFQGADFIEQTVDACNPLNAELKVVRS